MTTQAVLDDRYGRGGSRTRRRVTWAALLAVVVAIVVWFGWYTLVNPANGVNADATAFHLQERSVTVTFQLTAPAGTSVACAIEALDEEYGVVGWKVVEIPASDTHLRAFTEVVPTVAEATTGLVNDCWVT
jgi:hypothetical protein